MAGFSVPFMLFGLFIAFFGAQGADHYEGRTRLSRRSTDTDLKNKLDSIMSMLGKLHAKIDSQEQRIAALSRQVGNINCNGEQSKGNRTALKPLGCTMQQLYWKVYLISEMNLLVYLRYCLIIEKKKQGRGLSWRQIQVVEGQIS